MKIRCLKCNDIIESKDLHDCVSCKCGDYSIGSIYKFIHLIIDKQRS